MATIQIGYSNVLESATLITATSATNYSTDRLKDRDFGKLWICGSSSSPQHIIINQSGTAIASNCVVIPYGHTLNGLTMTLAYGSDGITFGTTSVSWTQSGTSTIKQTYSSATPNYWRFSHTSGTGTMRMPELMLTNLVSFTAQPRISDLKESKYYCVKSLESKSGISTFMSYTTSKRKMEYSMIVGSTDKTYWENAQTYFDTYGPFFFVDHQGNNLFVELLDDLSFKPVTANKYELNVSLQEVI